MAAVRARHAAPHAARHLKRLHPTRARCVVTAAAVGALCLIEWTVGRHPAAFTHEEAAAIRHAARRLMFGGFVEPAELEDRTAWWLARRMLPRRLMQRRFARALADSALSETAPSRVTDAVARRLDSTTAGYVGLTLLRPKADPWLPHLGPIGSAAQALGLKSFYARWILADLSVWGQTGISKVHACRCGFYFCQSKMVALLPNARCMMAACLWLELCQHGGVWTACTALFGPVRPIYGNDSECPCAITLLQMSAEAGEQGTAAGESVPRRRAALPDRQRHSVGPP